MGENIRCGYHGAQFDAAGMCVGVPGQSVVPPKAKIRSYPVVEEHGYIWIWMGDSAGAADLSSIPSSFFRSKNPQWDGGYGHFESIRANYNLINDNLFDITHAEYVHPESFGGEEMRLFRNAKPGTEFIDGAMTYSSAARTIVFRMRSMNMASGGPFYRWMVATGLGRDSYPEPIDLDMEVTWAAPSFTTFLLNAKPSGTAKEAAVEVCNMHAVTPETESTSHYFYRSVRNYGDEKLGEAFIQGVRAIFEQDKPVLEAQQLRVGNVDLLSLQPVLFGGDMLPQMARRINTKLLQAESGSAQASSTR